MKNILFSLLFVFLGLPALAQTYYYSKSSGDLADVTTWGQNTDGTGTQPTNFSTNNCHYNVVNRTTVTLGANWTVSGTSSRVIVGDGIASTELVIPTTFSLTGRVYVSALGQLTIQNATNPTISTLNSASTVKFDAPGAQTIPANTYGTLIISNDRGGNDITFTGAVNVQDFTLSASNVGSYVTTGSTIFYNKSGGGQTIYSIIPYNNLRSGNGAGTNTTDGNLNITGTLTISNSSTLDMGTYALNTAAVSMGNSSATIATQNMSAAPISSGITFNSGVVNYNNSTGGQSIAPCTYSRLTLSNTSGTQTATGDIAVNTAIVTTAGGTLDMAGFALSGTVTSITNNGTISTQNASSAPLPTGKTWSGSAGTVVYNGSSSQTIVAGTYSGNLTVTGNKGGGTLTFEPGTVSISGLFDYSPTNVASITTTGNTIRYATTVGGRTIYSAIPYNNLTLANTSGTNTADGNISVDSVLTTSSNGTFALDIYQLTGTVTGVVNNGTITTACTINPPYPAGLDWTGTQGRVTFTSTTGGQYIPAGTYKYLVCSNTSGTNTVVSGDISVSNAITTSAAGGTLDLGTYALTGSPSITNSGTTQTANTSSAPLPTGKSWSGTVEYNGTSNQTMVAGTFSNLALSGARVGSPTITLENGTISVSGNFDVTATGISGYSVGTNTFSYTGNSARTVGGITYNDLVFANTGSTKTADGPITVNGNLYTTSNGTFALGDYQLLGVGSVTHNGTISTTCTLNPAIPAGKDWSTGTTGTIALSSTTGQQYLPGGQYKRVTCSNTSGTNHATGDIDISTTFTFTGGTSGAFDMGTSALTGTFTASGSGTLYTQNTSSAPIPASVSWPGYTNFNNPTGGQTVPAGTYTRLYISSSSGTDVANNDISVNSELNIQSGATLNMQSFAMSGTMSAINNDGTIRTSNTSTSPFTSGRTWNGAGTVVYDLSTGGQTVVTGTYNNNVTLANTSGTTTAAGTITINDTLTTSTGGTFSFPAANYYLAGTLTPVNNGTISTVSTVNPAVPAGNTWGGTIIYANTTGSQRIPSGTFNNLTFANTSGSQTASGAFDVNGNLATTNGGTLVMGNYQMGGTPTGVTNNGAITTSCTASPALPENMTWTGTTGSVTFLGTTSAQYIPGGTYKTLTCSNTSATNTATGNIAVTTTLVANNGGTLNMDVYALSGSFTQSGSGTIRTQNVGTTPLPVGKSWTGTVNYDAPTGRQTIVQGTYTNLTASHTSDTSFAGGNLTVSGVLNITNAGAVTNMGSYTLSGITSTSGSGMLATQNTSATPVPSGKIWAPTINYDRASGGQTVVTGTYTRLYIGNSSGTQTAGGALTVNTELNVGSGATFNMATNALSGTLSSINNDGTIATSNTSTAPFTSGKTWNGSGTVKYALATGGQTVMAGTYNNKLTLSNTSGTNTASGSITMNDTFTTTAGGTFAINTTSYILSGGFVPVHNGTLRTICTTNPPFPAGLTWGGTVIFTRSTGSQNIPQGTYNNLSLLNSTGTMTARGDLAINGALTTTSGGTMAMGIYQLTGSLSSVTNNGTITTTCTLNPAIPSGKTWSGTTGLVQFALSTGNQYIPAGTYKSITCSNTSDTNHVVGNISASGTITSTGNANGYLDMGTNTLTGTFTYAGSGTLLTQNTSSLPLPIGKTWTGTINYNNASGGQTVVQGTYAGLRTTNTSGTDLAGGNLIVNSRLVVSSGSTLNMQTSTLSGSFTTDTVDGLLSTNNTSASPFPSGKTWNGTGTISYNLSTGGQTVMSGTYNCALLLNNTSGTNTASGSIVANNDLTTTAGGTLSFTVTNRVLSGTFTPHNNGTIRTVCTSNPPLTNNNSWDGTIILAQTTGGQRIPTGTYNNLTLLNSSGSQTAVGDVTVNGTLTTTSGGTMAMSNYQLLGSPSAITNNGTINTTCTLNPAIPSGQNWSGTTGAVLFSKSTGMQYIPSGTYKTLTCSNTSDTNHVTGDITVSTTLTTTGGANGYFDMGTNQLSGSFSVAGAGTLLTQNSGSTPIPSGKIWTGTVNYNGTGAQTLVTGTFSNMALSGPRTGSPTITLANGTITVSANFTASTASGIGGYSVGTNTFSYTTNANNTVGGINYNNLIFANTGSTKTADGNVVVEGQLTTSSNGIFSLSTFNLGGALTGLTNNGTITTYSTDTACLPANKNWTGTTGAVIFASASGGQFLPPGTYKTLTCSNTSGENSATGDLSATTITVSGSGGTLNMGTHDLSATTISNVSGSVRSQSISATPLPSGKNTPNVSFTFDAASGGQTIPACTVNNLTCANTSGTQTAAGNVRVYGTLTTDTGNVVLDMATFLLQSPLTGIAGGGTIRTQNSTGSPIPSGFTWPQTIQYNRTTGGQFIVSGTYNGGLKNSNISGTNTVAAAASVNINGDLILDSSSTLSDNNRTISLSGNIIGTGTHLTSTSGAISMTGGGATIDGATLGNVTLNNAGGFELTGSATVNGTLTLTSGSLKLNQYNLTMGATAPAIAGTPSSSNMLVVNNAGQLLKMVSGTGSYTYPIGDTSGNYTPITINLTSGGFAGGAYVAATTIGTRHPNNANTNNYLKRYWEISTSGITTPIYNTSATYVTSDVVGWQSNISAGKYAGSLPWTKYGAADTISQVLSITGINNTSADVTGLSTPSPTVATTPDSILTCSGATVNVTATGSGDTVFTYSWAPSTFLSATTGATVAITPTTSGTVSVLTYTVTATDGNGFTATSNITVTVNPSAAAIGNNAPVCEGSSITLTNADTGGTWSVLDTTTASINPLSGILTGVAAGSTTISYTNSLGCYSTATATVNHTPGNITGNLLVCLGYTSALGNADAGGAWTSADTTIASVNSSNGLLTGIALGNTNITYTLPNTCFTNAEATVSALPANISGINTVCVGSSTTWNNASPGGTWSSSNTAIATVNTSTGLVTGVASGTAIISYTLPTGCFDTMIVNVSTSLPSIIGTTSVCVGQTTDLDYPISGGTWSSSSTTQATIDSATGIMTGVNAGGFTITYTLGAGCYKTQSASVKVTPIPIVGNATVCEGSTTGMTDYTGGLTAWTSSTPSVASIGTASGVVSGISAGTTTITYTIYTGCYTTKEITVNPLPAAITGSNAICAETYGTLSSTPGGTWSSSNTYVATIDTSGMYYGVTGGSATIYYTLPTSCRRTTTVTIGALPASITGTKLVCPTGTTTLHSATSGATWSSTAPSIATINASTGVVNGVDTGTVVISYTNASGCARTATVTVSTQPADIVGVNSMCVGSITILDNTDSGGTWSSSNISVASINSSSGQVTANSIGTATITYQASGAGCYTVSQVTVNSGLAAITGTTTVCLGATTTLSHSVPGGTWSSSNESIATIDSVTGIATAIAIGACTITYSSGSGCSRTTTLTVRSLPTSITGSTSICTGAHTTLSNATYGGTWSSSNTAIATINTSGLVTGVSSGNTDITYTIAGAGCYAIQNVTVNASLAPISGTAVVCVGAADTLTHTDPGGTWSSSNSSRVSVDSATGVITGISSGVATITYTAPGGCFATKVATVNNSPAGIYGTISACEGSTTTLASSPGGGAWSSGNTGIALINASTGVLTGVTAGNTDITYTLPNGCLIMREATINTTPSAISGFEATCVGGFTTLSSGTPGGTWSSTNTSVATIDTSGMVSGLSLGTSLISYTLSSGCRQTATVTVGTIPAAISGSYSLCAGNSISLSSTTSGLVWTSSNPAVASVDSTSGLVSGITSGTSVISYTFSAECYQTATVTVNGALAANAGNHTVCVGQHVSLSNPSGGGTWSSGSPSVATINTSTGYISGLAAGTATITYTQSGGCSTTSVVTVNASLSAISGASNVCLGNSTTLSHATPGGTWSSSNTSKATIDSATGVLNGISNGSLTITYSLGSGCYTTSSFMVYPQPLAIVGSPVTCESSSVVLTDYYYGGTWSSANPAVASIHYSSGLLSGASAGTSSITYQLPTGCYVTTIATINPLPSAIAGPDSVCSGSTISLTSATGGGTWSSSNNYVATIVSGTGIATGVIGGSATMYYTLPTGCKVSKSITVGNIPSSISGTLDICLGNSSTLSSTSGYTWSSDNPTIATISGGGVVSGIALGTATISYTHSSGCARTVIVTVNAALTANTGPTSVCKGQTITVTNPTVGGTWSSSTTSVAYINATTGLTTGSNTGTTTITYTYSPACRTVSTVTVNNAMSSVSGSATVCAGSAVTFSSSDAGGTWSSSNPAIASADSTTGSITGIAAGTSTVTYSLGSGCVKTRNITVYALPGAISGTFSVATGATTNLSSSTSGGTWSSSTPANGTIGVYNGIVSGISAGTTTITYRAGNGCSVYQEVTILASKTIATASVSNSNNIVELSIVPNPTNGAITIHVATAGQLTIYTLNGSLAGSYPIKSGDTRLNLPANIAAGTYICRYTGEDGSLASFRLIYEP